MAITVLIADDQAMVRQGLGALLSVQDDIQVVGEADTGLTAVREVARLKPDVVLMDVRMPQLNGLEATERILGGSGHRPHILMLTTFDIDDYVYEALRLGASGFMLKDAPIDELTHAVRVVARGDALLAPAITKRFIVEVTKRRGVVPVRSPKLDALTAREHDVLVLVAGGLSNAEIATRLYVGEQTVKTHAGKVFAKLGVRDRTQAVVFAYEHGVVTPGS